VNSKIVVDTIELYFRPPPKQEILCCLLCANYDSVNYSAKLAHVNARVCNVQRQAIA
jgi:hypothetical protein